jgi:DNA-binding MarR family transcriptional regulator
MNHKSSGNSYESAVKGYKLFFLLRLTADAIQKSREIELINFGISPQQALALVCIYSLKNKATPAELSRWLYREPNSITILLNRMEKLNLIKKRADKKRKNIIRLSLTKQGLEAYRHSIEFQTFLNIINLLPENKWKQLDSLLKIVWGDICKSLKLDTNSYFRNMENAKFEPSGSINQARISQNKKVKHTVPETT